MRNTYYITLHRAAFLFREKWGYSQKVHKNIMALGMKGSCCMNASASTWKLGSIGDDDLLLCHLLCTQRG